MSGGKAKHAVYAPKVLVSLKIVECQVIKPKAASGGWGRDGRLDWAGLEAGVSSRFGVR